tara:strand:+ start:2118 stop:3185 length:1068 start_codon:yes stop_codon:yes gene_type:complete
MSQTLQALNSILKYKQERERQKIDKSLAMLDMGRKIQQQEVDRRYNEELMQLRKQESLRAGRKEQRDILKAESDLKKSQLAIKKTEKELQILDDPTYQETLKEQQIALSDIQLEREKIALQNAKAKRKVDAFDQYKVVEENRYYQQSENLLNSMQSSGILPPVLFSKVSALVADEDFTIQKARDNILDSVDDEQKEYLEALIGKTSKYGDSLLTGIYGSEFNRSRATGVRDNSYLMEVLDDFAGSIANDASLQKLASNIGIEQQPLLDTLYAITRVQKNRRDVLKQINDGSTQQVLNRLAEIDVNRQIKELGETAAERNDLLFNPQQLISPEERDVLMQTINPRTGKPFTLEELE